MEIFAHNGIDHSSASEAAAHSLVSVLLTVLLVTAVVAALITLAVYILNRFSLVEIPVKEEEEE